MSDSHASYTSRCAAAFAAGELSPLQGGWVPRSTAPRYNTSCFALTTKLTCEFDHRRQRATEWQWTAIRGRLHAACAPPPMKAAYFTDLPHRILLLGDSRVRQLFESILCTHRHDLTDGVRRVIPAAERPCEVLPSEAYQGLYGEMDGAWAHHFALVLGGSAGSVWLDDVSVVAEV